MEDDAPEPTATLPTITTYATRHDGWTGDKMATFCEALAETAVVAEACDAARMGISGAYALRRRSPFFAAAWDASLTIARERLADTLLARSIEGNVEQIWRGGEIVGERRAIDNRLGLAILRRLDRLAETGFSTSSRGLRSADAPAPQAQPIPWDMMVDTLRTGTPDDVAAALALIKGDKVEEVEGPPNPLIPPQEEEGIDLTHRCWRDGIEGIWMTDFPPPAGFRGYESRPYDDAEDDEAYVRACSADEVAILEADAARDRAAERAEDEQLRDGWFDLLKSQAEQAPECAAPLQRTS